MRRSCLSERMTTSKQKKICFIGNAGSGKSTLSADVYVQLKKQNMNVELVPEYVRTDIQLNGPMTTIWEQYRTRNNQKEIEDAIPDNVEFMITDSGVLTPYFYSCLYADNTIPRQRIVLQDMYKLLLDDLYLRRYSHIFFLPMKETYAQNPNILSDGTRYQSKEEILTLEIHFDLVFTKLHKVDNIHVLACPLDERVDRVLDIITSDHQS
jgi:energy-coupling factor transporter ATP-binding protein EcfA2